MKRSIILLGIAAGLSFISSNLIAATAVSSTADVQFEVTGTCAIDTTSTGTTYAAFNAAYNPGVATINNTTGSVDVTCNDTMPYKVGVDAGLHVNGIQRRLQHTTDATQFIDYMVRTAVDVNWGDTGIATYDATYVPTTTEVVYDGTGNGLAQTLTVKYITQRNAAITGQYSDTLTFVVAWP